MNAFIKILISELDPTGTMEIIKSDFMNEAMLVYTRRKQEIDTFARTFQNINQTESVRKMKKSIVTSPLSMKKRSGPGMGNINGYSKMSSTNKDIGSRIKMSKMNMNSKSVIPANISNVNNSILSKKVGLSGCNFVIIFKLF
jgi:hypothetical protein